MLDKFIAILIALAPSFIKLAKELAAGDTSVETIMQQPDSYFVPGGLKDAEAAQGEAESHLPSDDLPTSSPS